MGDVEEGTSLESSRSEEPNMVVPFLNYDQQVARFEGEESSEDENENERKAPEETKLLETTVYKNLNGKHCFILEAGATIKNLTIYRDTVDTTNQETTNVPEGRTTETSRELQIRNDNESWLPKSEPGSSKAPGTFEYLVEHPKSPEDDIRTYVGDISEMIGDGKVDLRFHRERTYGNQTGGNSKLELPFRGSTANGNNMDGNRMALVPLRGATANEYNTDLLSTTGAGTQRNKYQLQYDAHMKPFPGIDDYRYHVREHYVPVKIYHQHRKGRNKNSDPVELENLFYRDFVDHGLPVRSVLVVAECGKTAFCQNILQRYSSGISAIAAFPFSSSLLFRVSLSKSVREQLHPYRNRIQDMNLLLIVDDYDPESKTQEQKLSKLLSTEHCIHDSLARSVSILLTTTPFQKNLVLESFDNRVELGKFGEDESSMFVTKLATECGDEDDGCLLEKTKTVTGDPIKDLNPLVLLTVCIILQEGREQEINDILSRCKYMLAWRCQKRAWCHKMNIVTKSLRLHKLPPFNELRINQLKMKHCKEAQSIMENSGIV